MLSGYFGGNVDTVAMRIVDGLLAFPGLLLYLLIVTLAREWKFEGIYNDIVLIFALGFAFMPEVARLSRGSVLVEKQKEYVEASRAIGDGSLSIALRQILPNIVSPLIVNATVRLGFVILIVAALSFLGLGTPPPTPDWGSDLSAARDYMETASADRGLPGPRHLLHGAGLQPVRRRPARHPRSAAGGALSMAETVLALDELTVRFRLRRGDLTAVDGVSFSIERGQTFGLVGESGSGKSVTAKAIMRLIPDPPGEIPHGRVLFEGSNILDKSDAEMRALRGRRIAMVFQEPMSALNPVFTVCDQISDALRTNLGLSKAEARERVVELLSLVGIPSPQKRLDSYVHEFSGGMRQRVMLAMALSLQSRLPDRRRADHRARRHHPGHHPRADHRHDRAPGHVAALHHPQSRRRRPCLRPRRRDVRQPHRRARRQARDLRQPAAPLHGGPAELDPAARRPGQVPDADRGLGVQHDGAALGL